MQSNVLRRKQTQTDAIRRDWSSSTLRQRTRWPVATCVISQEIVPASGPIIVRMPRRVPRKRSSARSPE